LNVLQYICYLSGQTACVDKCCPPGLECCYDYPSNTWQCKTHCGPS
jgi:hypothetical protein